VELTRNKYSSDWREDFEPRKGIILLQEAVALSLLHLVTCNSLLNESFMHQPHNSIHHKMHHTNWDKHCASWKYKIALEGVLQSSW